MKKLLVLGLAVVLVVAFTVPASALESVFGGLIHSKISLAMLTSAERIRRP
jgi:hypothetical protein